MTQMSSSTVSDSLTPVEIKPGLRFTVPVLKMLLPDVETVLFFGMVYELTFTQLANVMHMVLGSDLARELAKGDHSTELQGYVLDPGWLPAAVSKGSVTLTSSAQPKGEILPELWKSLEIEVAQSIKDVATKLKDTVGLMPGKQGAMVFNNLMVMNKRRPVIGDYRAQVQHAPVKDNLVILDVSGSMTEATIRAIVEDVVALSFMANAYLAIVSNTTTVWEPGAYTAADVLRQSEFGGTHYETLGPVLNARDWGVVVTLADYDSARDARVALGRYVKRRIDKVVDISLVNRPTFLAECVGQFADEVRPLLVATSTYVLSQ